LRIVLTAGGAGRRRAPAAAGGWPTGWRDGLRYRLSHHGEMRIPCGTALAGVFACGLSLPLLAGPADSACGDQHIDGNEQWGGTGVGGLTCTDLRGGFVPPGQGTLACQADCTFDARDCLRVLVERLIPAKGPARNRCQLEWGTVGPTAGSGRVPQRFCKDGDPTCDQDGAANLVCRV